MAGFRKKKSNRRFRRRHVLDVKLSAQQRRETRLRRGFLVATAFLSVLAGGLLAWHGGDWLLRRFIYENPAFAIHHLDVQTDGVIAPEQIRHWAGVKLQDNLLALDLARVKRDLELVPIVQAVAVERALPHTLRIRVTEREPIVKSIFPAQSASGGIEQRTYLLDKYGVVMLPLELHQRAIPEVTNAHLPQLIGVPANKLRPGRQAQSPQVLAAVEWIEAFDGSPMADLVTVRDVDVAVPNLLLVATMEGASVTFSRGHLETQLSRWQVVHEHSQRQAKAISWLDLSVSNNVPVIWLEASLLPPPQPKPPKSPRTKRKHV